MIGSKYPSSATTEQRSNVELDRAKTRNTLEIIVIVCFDVIVVQLSRSTTYGYDSNDGNVMRWKLCIYWMSTFLRKTKVNIFSRGNDLMLIGVRCGCF